ncbi:MAG: SMP-30/gluconolactonase/LRE family protein, partial [Proteobacteria bacterium]|nr:SMP-30/gluconolactonase/LRE family protein [Pseudomonadota bacterium]
MKKSTFAIILVAAMLLYFIAWPVPIDPVAWDAPVDRGLSGVFERNDVLQKARAIDLGEHTGPEDVALGPDGFLYVSTDDGKILKIPTSGGPVEVFARPGGRPLGLEFDADGSLLVANAIFGVQRISTRGEVSLVFSEADGKPLVLADDIAVAADGRIYLSEASTKFGTVASKGTLRASVLDMLEHGGNGFVVEYK